MLNNSDGSAVKSLVTSGGDPNGTSVLTVPSATESNATSVVLKNLELQLSVYDSQNNPLPNSEIQVWDEDKRSLLASKYSNSQGLFNERVRPKDNSQFIYVMAIFGSVRSNYFKIPVSKIDGSVWKLILNLSSSTITQIGPILNEDSSILSGIGAIFGGGGTASSGSNSTNTSTSTVTVPPVTPVNQVTPQVTTEEITPTSTSFQYNTTRSIELNAQIVDQDQEPIPGALLEIFSLNPDKTYKARLLSVVSSSSPQTRNGITYPVGSVNGSFVVANTDLSIGADVSILGESTQNQVIDIQSIDSSGRVYKITIRIRKVTVPTNVVEVNTNPSSGTSSSTSYTVNNGSSNTSTTTTVVTNPTTGETSVTTSTSISTSTSTNTNVATSTNTSTNTSVSTSTNTSSNTGSSSTGTSSNVATSTNTSTGNSTQTNTSTSTSTSVVITDRDSDGVPDNLDQFPDDPKKAFTIRIPSTGVNTIAFEDNYPKAGDADLNDYVVVYFIEEDQSADGKIAEIRGNYQLLAQVSGYRAQAFWIRFPSGLANKFNFSSQVYNSSGVLQPSKPMSKSTSSEWSSITKFVPSAIDLNDGFRIFGPSSANDSSGVLMVPMWNGRISSTQATSRGIAAKCNDNRAVNDTASINPGPITKIRLEFTNPVDRSSIGSAPYDVYTRLEGRAYSASDPQDAPRAVTVALQTKEIHQPGYYFYKSNATVDGASRLIGDDLYLDKTNFPWLIHVPGMFKYPLECFDMRNAATTAYPKFKNWMDSKGTTNSNWYEDASALNSPYTFYSFVSDPIQKRKLDEPSSSLLQRWPLFVILFMGGGSFFYGFFLNGFLRRNRKISPT
jgi:protocatechuate 3,4-dioxygenase beta subunit